MTSRRQLDDGRETVLEPLAPTASPLTGNSHLSRFGSRAGAAIRESRWMVMGVTWAVVFTSGYGAMWMFWQHADHAVERGFPFFISGTWGDALFLPILAAAMVGYLRFAGQPACSCSQQIWMERFAVLGGALAAMVGVSIQLSWVMSSATVTNWTIPEAHTFNSAGLYHAFFFILALGFDVYLAIRVLTRRWQMSGLPTDSSVYADLCFALMWFGAIGYWLMRRAEQHQLLFDDARQVIAFIGVAVGLSLVYSVLPLIRRRSILSDLLHDLRAIVAGVLLAYAVSIRIVAPDVGGVGAVPLFAVALSLYFIGLVIPRAQATGRTLMMAAYLAFTGLGMGSLIILARTDAQAVAAGSGAILVASFVALDQTRYERGGVAARRWKEHIAASLSRLKNVWPSLWAPWRGIAVAALYGIISRDTVRGWLDSFLSPWVVFALVDLLVRVGIIASTVWVIKKVFSDCTSPERVLHGDDDAGWTSLRLAKRTMWVPLCALASGLVVLVLAFFVQAQPQAARLTASPVGFLAASVGGLMIVLGAIATSAGRTRTRGWRVLGLVAVLLLYTCLTVYISDLRKPWLCGFVDAMAFFPIVGAATFITNGLISNMRLLLGGSARGSRPAALMVWCGSVAVFAVSVLPTESGQHVFLPSLVSPAVGLLGCLVGATVPPLLAARLVRIAPDHKTYLRDTEIDGVLQDSRNAFFIVAGGGLVATHIAAALINAGKNGSSMAWVLLALSLISIWMVIARVVMSTLAENHKHLVDPRATRKLFPAPITSTEQATVQFKALKAHLERQSWIVVFALALWSASLWVDWRRSRHSYVAEPESGSEQDTNETSAGEHAGDYLYRRYLLELSLITGRHSKNLDSAVLGLPVEQTAGWWLSSLVGRRPRTDLAIPVHRRDARPHV